MIKNCKFRLSTVWKSKFHGKRYMVRRFDEESNIHPHMAIFLTQFPTTSILADCVKAE